MEEMIERSYGALQKFFFKVEYDSFVNKVREKVNIKEGELFEKMSFIENYINLHLEEKKEFFINSTYEMKSLEANLDRLFRTTSFEQENFKNMIEKCKNLIKSERENFLHIEKLKKEILVKEEQKVAVVVKTKKLIEDLKGDNLHLIDCLEKEKKDNFKLEKEKNDFAKKNDDMYKKTQEIIVLKNEIEKSKVSNERDKRRVICNKDKEINGLADRLGFAAKYQKEIDTINRESCKQKVLINEMKIELQKNKTEIARHIAEKHKLSNELDEIAKKAINYENKYRETRVTLNILINSKFKDLKKDYLKNIDLVEKDSCTESINQTTSDQYL